MASNDADHPFPAAAAAAGQEEDAVPQIAGEEEDTGAQVAPIIQLQEVAVTTGEEDEDAVLDMKAKLYRFDKESNQWKERGTGSVKLLKHKQSGKVRLVMRQSKTLKIVANHFVTPSTKMQEHAGNEKSCVWQAVDYSDGELKAEMFCIRFGSIENCKKFMADVEKYADGNVEQTDGGDPTAVAEVIEIAELVEALAVSEGSTSAAGETVTVGESSTSAAGETVTVGESSAVQADESVNVAPSAGHEPKVEESSPSA